MRRLLLVSFIAFGLLPIATPARAECVAPDPDTLTFEQMIEQGTTGDDDFDRMIIGRVVAVRDRGEVGGRATAVIHVAAHPTGYVPERARVRFRAYPPGIWVEDSVEFAVGERWVIIATRKDGGRYQHDGGCGQTQKVPRHRYAELIGLTGVHDDRRSSCQRST